MCWYSVLSARRNLRRAGTLKNRSRTSTLVPGGCEAGAGAPSAPSRASTLQACSAPLEREVSDSRDTEAMLGSASPRNPRVATRSRSDERCDLAGRVPGEREAISCGSMPMPSSRTRISPQPPRSSSTSMREAPASREFSTSSLTTEAGRSITSPAAIWLMSSSARIWMDKGHLANALRTARARATHFRTARCGPRRLSAAVVLGRGELGPWRAGGDLRDARARRRIGIEILAQALMNRRGELRLVREARAAAAPRRDWRCRPSRPAWRECPAISAP